MKKPLMIVNAILKVLICPFFFFLCYLILTSSHAYFIGAFENYFEEALFGIALEISIIAPVAFIIVTFISLIFFRVYNKIYLLDNDKFLAIWGSVMAVITYIALLSFAGIVEVFYLLF